MSIEQQDVIDFIGVHKDFDQEVELTISDHLEWEEDVMGHLLLLQEKINSYLAFIESGEILESYPKAKGKKPIIRVVGKYPLCEEAREFYEKASPVISEAGFELRFELFSKE